MILDHSEGVTKRQRNSISISPTSYKFYKCSYVRNNIFLPASTVPSNPFIIKLRGLMLREYATILLVVIFGEVVVC